MRAALLEADVELGVVRAFLDAVRERLSGDVLSQSLTPGQQVIKAVNEQLVEVLGGTPLKITYASRPPTVVLLAGLQGAGKTTTAAKLANWFKQQGRQPLLVAADLQRPAAVEQLRVLGSRSASTSSPSRATPLAVATRGVEEARRLGRDVVIIDTAGRLAIDEALMDEVRRIYEATSPDYTFLVIDAVTGQDAVHTARSFHDALGADGTDRDQARLRRAWRRGPLGARRRRSTGRLRLERRAPRRLRPLLPRSHGLADPGDGRRALADRAGRAHHGRRRRRPERGPHDERDLHARRLPGPAEPGAQDGLPRRASCSLMPGVTKEMRSAASNIDEGELNRVEAIVRSMTPQERRDPSIIDGSRRTRIARGSATSVAAVNQLLKQFGEMRKMMR